MGSYSPERTCRTCLESKDELTSLYTKDDSTGHTLLEKLRDCASMQVAVSVHVPMHSCLQCVRRINEFYDFKQLCERSEKTLEGLHDPLSCEGASAVDIELPLAFEIKTEPFDATECTVEKFEVPSISSNDGPEVEAKIKNDERNRSCEICGKSFQRASHLQRHMVSHTDDRPFPCADCGKRFKTEETAKRHAIVHLQKDHVTCGIRSNDEHELIEQANMCQSETARDDVNSEVESKRTGTTSSTATDAEQLKPHECEICGKRFVSRRNLRRHSLIHDKKSLDLCETKPSLTVLTQHTQSKCSTCGEQEVSLDDHKCLAISDDKDNAEIGTTEKEQQSCDVCGMEFWYLSDLSNHRSRHSLDRPFLCGRCPKSFKTKQKLQLHDRDHLMQERQCDGCDELFDSPDEMLEHRSATHPDLGPFKCKDEILLKCKLCSKSFTSSLGLKEHIRTMHGDSLHRCEKCNMFYFTEKQLLVHKEKQDCDKNHNCELCESSFTSRRKLNVHRHRHHPKRLHCCEHCGASFSAPYFLRRHMEKHEQGSKYICETCGKVYKFERSLSVHIKDYHSAERPVYECKVCGKQYNIVHSYYKHILLHKDEQNEYECAVCKKRLKSKMQFDQHMRCHNKRHGCDICGKLFRKIKELAIHKLCHARDSAKPFTCKLCPKRFSTAAAVSFHVSTLHNAKKHLKCDVCGMEFYNRFHYAAHYSKHTGVKPYQCDICGKGYNFNQNFIPHRKRCAAQQAKGRNEEAEVTSTLAS